MKISDIKPYEKNAKQHPNWHIEKIANSIKAFGCKQPIVIDSKGVIIAGHGRFIAMTEKLGYTKLLPKSHTPKGEEAIPYVLADDLSAKEVKALRLADNQLNAITGVDMAVVLEELHDLNDDGFDVELTGFDTDLLTDAEEDNADLDEITGNASGNKAKIQAGDIFELDGHRLLCGDSRKIEDLSRLMGGGDSFNGFHRSTIQYCV